MIVVVSANRAPVCRVAPIVSAIEGPLPQVDAATFKAVGDGNFRPEINRFFPNTGGPRIRLENFCGRSVAACVC
jgi:hypothetical protein